MFKFIVLALAFFAVAQAGVVPVVRTIAAPLTVAVPAEDTGKWDGCHWDGRAFDCLKLGERYAPKGLPIVTSAVVAAPSVYSYPLAHSIIPGTPLASNIIIN
ncbi:uncharacterized protein LOC134827355 [Culicoides brevitarsis]|uniref:uncharacterized protein LOC134827355 n=1 Tax=Culicoides brevitarsis TaxID=469753 RepID=UPI00307CAA26